MAADLPPFVLDVAAWLVTYALHSTVLLLAALVGFAWIGRLARRSPRFADAAPAWRENLGRVALLAGVVTASVQTALEIEPFGLRPALREHAASELASVSPVEPAPATAPRTAAPAPFSNVPLLLVPAVAAYLVEFGDLRGSEVSQAAKPEAAREVGHEPPTPSADEADPAVAARIAGPSATSLARAEPESIVAQTGTASTSTRPDLALPQHSSSAPAPVGGALTPWIAAFVALWAAIALFAFARRVLGWRALQSSLAGAEPVADPHVRAEFRRICARAGLGGPGSSPRLLVAPLLAAPVTRGILRHDVCIPPRALTDLDDEEREALFGHEIAHARRRDPAWLAVHRAIEVVFCLQPLNRVVTRRLEDDAELLCDDRAVLWTDGRLALASCLTEVASWLVAARGAPRLAAPMAAHGVRLTRRVERIVDEAHAPDAGRRRPLIAAASAALAAGAIVVVPGFAGQREHKPLPLDLTLELMMSAPADDPGGRDGREEPLAVGIDGAGPSHDAIDPSAGEDAPAVPIESSSPDAAFVEADEVLADSASADPTAATTPNAILGSVPVRDAHGAGAVQVRGASHPAPGGAQAALVPAVDSARLVPPGRVQADVARVDREAPAVDALDALLAELDAEVELLVRGLDERCGAEPLRGDVERLARRVSDLRARAAAVQTLLDAANTNLSPDPIGRTAQDR